MNRILNVCGGGGGLSKNLVIALLAVLLAGSIGFGAHAQSGRTANVEIRVWESTSDPTQNYISARPAGGSWRTLGTIPLGKGAASEYEKTSNGRFRYSDITLAVPLPETAAAAPTETPTPTTSRTAADCDTSSSRWDYTARERELRQAKRANGWFAAYSGQTVGSTREVQIDHIIPKNYACVNGAFAWTDEKVKRFVNADANLVAVLGGVNASKRDKGPADWLPTEARINYGGGDRWDYGASRGWRCQYVEAWRLTAQRFELELPARDTAALDAEWTAANCDTYR